MAENSPYEKGLFTVLVVGTALGFGTLAAIIVSMKDFVGGDARFSFSKATVLAFVLGGAAGWFFWRLVRRLVRKASQEPTPPRPTLEDRT
jgi:hypothetical protein